MPIVETISIINKSGKVVSTSKHLVNIFKDAKEAYQEKKAEIRAELHQKNAERVERKLLKNGRVHEISLETGSQRSDRHGHRSRSIEAPNSRPALTERNLATASEASAPSSRRSSRHGGEYSSRSPRSPRSPGAYQAPYFENDDISRPDLSRRHTDSIPVERGQITRRPIYAPPLRTMSSPNMGDENIDMHLAYGDIPPPLPHEVALSPAEKERELKGLMSRLDKIMLEAQCVQHSATTIISSLQANPEAMAAVALTLAEISNIVTKMSPGILATIKGGSPAIFALLASPQFLIAGGVAVGVTIVMFGGYKIIKKIRADAAIKAEASRMDEALVYEGDLGSIESWRRGIANEEARSVTISVDGEFITPEAARLKKERIRERAREERRTGSESAERSSRGHGYERERERPRRALSADGSQRTITGKPAPSRSGTRTVVSESVRSESTTKPSSSAKKEKKAKKPSALTVLFKKGKSEKEKTGSSSSSKNHKQPKLLEM